MRSRRGLRVRPEPVHVSMVRRRFESSRTVFARSPRYPVRHARCGDSFELGRACPWCAWKRPWASRPAMRPIDFCTPKPFPLEHSCSRRFPAQRLVPVRGLAAPARGSLSSRSLAAPCPSTPASSLVCRSARPKTREPGTGRLGATRCRRDWGEPRFTARFPLRRSALSTRNGVFFRHARRIPLASGTLVASSGLVGVGRFGRVPRFGSKAAKTGSAGAS